MNGKQARNLRRILDLVKPTDATVSGLEQRTKQDGSVYFVFLQRKNPEMNFYRAMKRRSIRGW